MIFTIAMATHPKARTVGGTRASVAAMTGVEEEVDEEAEEEGDLEADTELAAGGGSWKHSGGSGVVIKVQKVKRRNNLTRRR